MVLGSWSLVLQAHNPRSAPGIFTPVVSMRLRNSIVWLTSLTSSRPSVVSSRSTARIPPPTACAAAQRQLADGAVDRAIAGPPAARRIGDPVLAGAVDRADRLVADHEGTNITAGLAHIFLHVEDVLLPRAEHLQVFQQRLGRVAIVDSRYHAAPRADYRLDHHRIAQSLDRFECRFRRKRQQRARLSARLRAAALRSSETCRRRSRRRPCRLTQRTPRASIACSAYSERPKETERSSTVSKREVCCSRSNTSSPSSSR